MKKLMPAVARCMSALVVAGCATQRDLENLSFQVKHPQSRVQLTESKRREGQGDRQVPKAQGDS
jgi:outer membrane murein-binding lipoprotein Lpp